VGQSYRHRLTEHLRSKFTINCVLPVTVSFDVCVLPLIFKVQCYRHAPKVCQILLIFDIQYQCLGLEYKNLFFYLSILFCLNNEKRIRHKFLQPGIVKFLINHKFDWKTSCALMILWWFLTEFTFFMLIENCHHSMTNFNMESYWSEKEKNVL
jgi:hypothetical protein